LERRGRQAGGERGKGKRCAEIFQVSPYPPKKKDRGPGKLWIKEKAQVFQRGKERTGGVLRQKGRLYLAEEGGDWRS